MLKLIGSENTKFFHARASNRRHKNNITGLRDEEGSWHDKDCELEEIISTYLRKMFMSTHPTTEQMDEALVNLQSKVMDHMNEELMMECTEVEVRAVLQCMQPLKSPGPDVFQLFSIKSIGE